MVMNTDTEHEDEIKLMENILDLITAHDNKYQCGGHFENTIATVIMMRLLDLTNPPINRMMKNLVKTVKQKYEYMKIW